MATDAEVACFEAGIKFGSLYHQFAGTPVSPESAATLERAMEEAIENQPHCTGVTVEIHEDAVTDELVEGYTELTGRFFSVEVTVAYEDVEVEGRMRMEDGYPRMRITSVE